MSVRRLWWGISALGFAVFIAVALRYNLRQGLALLALALVVLIAAYIYDRALRRT